MNYIKMRKNYKGFYYYIKINENNTNNTFDDLQKYKWESHIMWS